MAGLTKCQFRAFIIISYQRIDRSYIKMWKSDIISLPQITEGEESSLTTAIHEFVVAFHCQISSSFSTDHQKSLEIVIMC